MSDTLTKVRAIPEINVEEGIKICAGNEKIYEKALNMLNDKLMPTIEDIRANYKADFKTYIVQVHGIKSSLANVGIDTLSKKALALELAGKNEDTEFSNTNLEPFLDELAALGVTLKCALTGEHTELMTGTPEILKENIAKLIQAIEDYEFNAADESFDELAKYDFGAEVSAKLKEMRKLADAFDMDEVSAIAAAMT